MVTENPPSVLVVFYAAVLLAAAWTDLRARRIPNALTIPATSVALIVALSLGVGASALVGAAVGAVAFVVPMFLYGRASAGGGDVKLAAFVGAMLGIEGILGALFLTGLAASVVVLVGLATKRMARRSRIPFGPFLALGGLAALLLG